PPPSPTRRSSDLFEAQAGAGASRPEGVRGGFGPERDPGGGAPGDPGDRGADGVAPGPGGPVLPQAGAGQRAAERAGGAGGGWPGAAGAYRDPAEAAFRRCDRGDQRQRPGDQPGSAEADLRAVRDHEVEGDG